jgi:hypothetical protein
MKTREARDLSGGNRNGQRTRFNSSALKNSGLGLACVAVLTVWWIAMAGQFEQTGGAAGIADASASHLPRLPVVEKPSASQPTVGLPADIHLDKAPPRQTKGLDLVKLGWTYDCMECHKLLSARWQYDRPMVEHQAIKLNHGNNRFCLNCHHPTNRNAFVDYDGSEIPEAQVVLLCAKCHGPTYRDWEAGAHGRRNGFWDSERGQQTRLRCIQCHDPHQPKFQAMKPLPPLRYPSRAPGPRAASSPKRH